MASVLCRPAWLACEGILFAALAGCGTDNSGGGAHAAGCVSSALVVCTKSGQVRGATDGNFRAFRGILYAAPPVGNLRWLTLNVYAVNPPASSKQPVIVFIHGGGNVLDSAQDMPWGATPALAGHDVIVVTVEYRLRLLGFLVNPVLTAESAQGSSGNYGLMDLIAALQWVRDNITEFGGDPARTMIDDRRPERIRRGALDTVRREQWGYSSA
jgi:para-nitrobenzyl esterase